MTLPFSRCPFRYGNLSSVLLALVFLIIQTPAPLRAANYHWDATPGTADVQAGGGTWSTGLTNWLIDGLAPNVGWNNSFHTAIFAAGTFGAPGSVLLGEGVTAAGLQFDVAGYTIDGNGFVLTLDRGDDTTPTMVTNANATITAALAGNDGLTKSGTGTLTLSGSAVNTYTGLTTVTAGSLTLNKTGAPAIAGNITVSGGALQFTTSNQIADTATVTLDHASSAFNSTAPNVGQSDNIGDTFANLFVTAGSVTTGASSTGFNITGTTRFTGGATSNTIFVGNSGSTFRTHRLELIAMSGGGASTTTPNSFTVYGNNAVRMSSLFVGAGGLSLDGSRLNFRAGMGSALGSRLVLDGDVTTTGTAASFIHYDTASGTVGGTRVELSSGTAALSRGFQIGGGGANLTINLVITNGASSSAGITKTGAGTLILSGTEANTYTGLTVINEGTLQLSKTAGVTAVSGNIEVNTGGSLTLSTANQLGAGTHIFVNGGTVNAIGTAQTFANYNQTAGGLVASGNVGDVTITDTLTLLGGNTVTINSGSPTDTAAWTLNKAVLSGAGILMGGNSGTGAPRTLLTIGAGGLTLAGQTITLNHGNSGVQLNLHGDVTTTGNAFLSASGSGGVAPLINLGTGTRTFNIGSGALDVSAQIEASAANLRKTGVGRLSLLAQADYTGTTTVEGGSLLVTGTAGRLTATTSLLVTGGELQNGSPVATSNNGVVNRINTAAGLTLGGSLGGGIFTHAAAAAGQSHSQTLASLAIASGLNTLRTTAATGTNTLTFAGAYTRAAGGWLNIALQTGFTVHFTQDPLSNGSSITGSGAAAILSGATLNQTDFIKAQSGAVTAATYVDTGTDTWTAGANMNVTGSNGTAFAATTINSLRYHQAGANTITLTGTHTLDSGMILVTTGVGANATGLTGGIVEAASGGELHVMQHNAAGIFTIGSILNSSLLKTGAGVLVLEGLNTYSGTTRVMDGTLRAAPTALSANSSLELNNGVLETSGTFSRALGTASGEVALTGGAAGFSAFGGPLTVNLGGAGAVITWGGAHFTPTTLVLNAATATATLDFQNGLDLNGASRTVAVHSPTQAATLSGIVQGTGSASSLIKTGTGTLILGNANTYAGGTTLSAGTLLAGHNSAFGTGTVTLQTGAFGAFGADRVLSNNFELRPVIATTVSVTGSQNLTITGSFTVSGSSATDLTNSLSGGRTLELAGPVYLADTNVSNVWRIFGGGNTLVSGIISNNAAGNTAASHLHYNGSGIFRLTGANTYTGSTLAAGAGAIAIRSDANLGTAPTSSYVDNVILAAGGRLLVEETFNLNSNRHIGIGNSGGGSTTGIIDVANGKTFGVAGTIADRTRNQDASSTTPANVGSLQKSGLGALVLSGNNTYSGLTTVANGVLRLGSSQALGGTAQGTVVNSGAQLELLDGVVISGETLSISGVGQGNPANTPPGSPDVNRGALQAAAGATAEWAGNILLANAGTNRVGTQANGTLLISGVIDDGANNYILELSADSNGGTVILSGANTYGDGTTAITRTIRGTTKLGAHNTLPTWTTLDLHFAASNNAELATLDMNGFNQAVKELLNTGDSNTSAVLTNAATTRSTFTLNQDSTTTYGGIITGNLSLVKNGTGTLILTRVNTYSGNTVINSGTVRATGGDAIADGGGKGNVVLDGGATAAGTLDVRNTETINGLDGTSGTVAGRVVNDNTTAGQVTLRIGAGQADGSFAGQILDNSGGGLTGTLALMKLGGGTQTLSGANAFSGPVVIYDGTLVLDYAASDPLNGNVIRMAGGSLVLKGSASGTTDSFSTLNIHASTLSQVTVDQSADGSSTWTTSGLAAFSGGGGAQGLLLLDRSSGANLVSTATFSGLFMTGSRAIAYVKDATGTGFMTQNGSGELVRYTAYTDAGTAADQTVGNHSGDASQAYASTANLRMTGSVTRTANMNFATLLVDGGSTDLTLNLNGSDLLTTASDGRSILITGSGDFTLTGTAASTINNSIYITSFSTGKTTLDVAVLTGNALVTGGTGFMEYTKTVVADLYALGNLLRLSGEQDYSATGTLRLSSGGVLEIGADLATATADADFTRVMGTNMRLYGDAGFSAYTSTPGGTRVVRLGTAAAGDGGMLTWGGSNFLVSQESSASDVDGIFKLSSVESNATLEFQNPISFNSKVRTVEVANGSATVDARLTGVLSSPSGGLIKTGTGTLELTAANTYGAGTEVRSGTILVNNTTGSATGTGHLRIFNGARLGGTGVAGSTTTAAHITADAGSVITVGNTHALTTASGGVASTLTLATTSSGVISLNGTIEFDLFGNNDAVNPTGNNDVLRFSSAESIELGGTLVVANSTGTDSTAWLLNSTWQLIDWTSVTAGTRVTGSFNLTSLPDLDPAYAWDLSQLYTAGTISISYVPEPSRAMLTGLAVGAWLLRRRRRVARP